MKKGRVGRAIWRRVCQEKKSWGFIFNRKRKDNDSVAIFIYKLCIFVNEDKNEITLLMV